jgi:DNA-binding NarL/FixJ family response regulator
MHEESPLAERVLRAGARGYITKQEATRNVLVAIRTILAGDLYLSDKAALQVASKVATTIPANSKRSFDKLSDRELRVLELIGRGHGTRQIAEMLNLGVPTIETYRARIKDKLHLRDASELLQYAIRWNHSGGTA